MKKLPDTRVRDHFLGWQCRIRQIAMREAGGRPSPGMRPRLLIGSEQVSDGLTVLIVPRAPKESTDFLKFQVQKSNDPRVVYTKGLEHLASTHFQLSARFSDEMTAVFPPKSAIARRLLGAGECLLEFDEYSQNFKMICSVRALAPRSEAFQATLWHNRIFNPELASNVTILGLEPQWKSAQAHPEPN